MSDAARPLQSVLFVCSLNSVRSPMAEGVAKQILGRRLYVDSAGLKKTPRDPFTLAALREIGVEFADDDPHTIEEVSFESFDLIITLSQEARDRIADRARASAVELVHWQIDDPTLSEGSREARLQVYRAVRDRLAALVREQIVPRLRRPA